MQSDTASLNCARLVVPLVEPLVVLVQLDRHDAVERDDRALGASFDDPVRKPLDVVQQANPLSD
jgi:hypothetical protein